jgi:hypothetical protein
MHLYIFQINELSHSFVMEYFIFTKSDYIQTISNKTLCYYKINNLI